jgi:hypothetical protein
VHAGVSRASLTLLLEFAAFFATAADPEFPIRTLQKNRVCRFQRESRVKFVVLISPPGNSGHGSSSIKAAPQPT